MSYKKEITWVFANKDPSIIMNLCRMRTTDKEGFDEFCTDLGDELDSVRLGELVEAASKSNDKEKFLKVLSKVSGEVQANIIFYGICKTEEEFSAFVDRSYHRFASSKSTPKRERTRTSVALSH